MTPPLIKPQVRALRARWPVDGRRAWSMGECARSMSMGPSDIGAFAGWLSVVDGSIATVTDTLNDTVNDAPQSEAGTTGDSKSKIRHLSGAFDNWLQYFKSTESLVHLTYTGFSRTAGVSDAHRILKSPQADIDRAEQDAVLAQREADGGFPTLHAHSLLGLWGAFECFVEDIFKATIKANPSLLGGGAFAKIKLPIDILFASDDERAETVLNELTRATSSEKSIGVTQFERILGPINLGGAVPTRVKDAVFLAQQIRHVWAHRGGVADATFAERCPDRAQNGVKIQINSDEFYYLASGLSMYSAIIINRYFKAVDMGPVFRENIGFEGIFAELGFGASIT